MKKLIAAITTGLIAVALVLVGAAAPASAHVATIEGSNVCTTDTGAAVVTWKVTNTYTTNLTISASSNPTLVPVNTAISAGKSLSFTQDIPAPAAGVTASLTLSFHWSDFDQNNVNATTQVSKTCTVPIPRDASASLDDTLPVCGAAETVTEGDVANATWGDITSYVSHSVTYYTATATAVAGHEFGSASTDGSVSSDKSKEVFTWTLKPAPNASECKDAAAAVTFSSATCDSAETVALGAITDATWGTLTYPTGSSYSVTATAKSGFEFSNGQTTLTLSGSLDSQLSGHPCETYKIVAWLMPSWDAPQSPTWPQSIVGSHPESTPDLSYYDSLAEQCGVQYQIDIYYDSPETAALIAGGELYGPNDGGTPTSNENLPEDLIAGGWGVAYKLIQGPACATPATPTVATTCNEGGSITITPAEGVTYYVNGNAVDTSGGTVNVAVNDGQNVVTAVANQGYELSGYPAGGWTFDVNSDCTANYDSSSTCTVGANGSTEDVSITFDNPTSNDATYTVTTGDGTLNGTGIYVVKAGTSETDVVGSVGTSGGSFMVSINGADATTVNAPAFNGCVPVSAGDPFVTNQTCDSATNTVGGGSLTVDLEVGLSYTVTGPNGYEVDNLTPAINSGHSGDYVVGTGLTPGDYIVSVVAVPPYVLAPGFATDWPLTITLPTTFCDFGVTVTPATCSIDTTSSKFNATGEVEGSITVDLNDNVVYTAVNTVTNVQTVLTTATTFMADGSYDVVVTLSPTGVTNGFVLDGTVSFGPYVFTDPCLTTEATWNAGVSHTAATCSATTAVKGTISLEHDADQKGDVIYTITNSHGVVVYHGTNTVDGVWTVVHVGPGSYTVSAVPTDPATHGLSGNGSVKGDSESWPITIDTVGTDCDGNLAFTGGTIAWLGFVLAGGMLFLGFALLYMRRRGNRTAE